MFPFKDSIIFRNAYKLVPLLVLAYGLSKGIGRGKSLGNFSYAVTVQSEVNNIARRIRQDSAMGDKIPTAEEFPDWIRSNFRKKEGIHRDQAIDLWGNPYGLSIDGAMAKVISAGADKKLGTADDIVADAQIELGATQ